MIRYKRLKMTLLLLGMTGCACLPETQTNCPPTVPILPLANQNGVHLTPSDMASLLIFLEDVERCQ